jgi:hypothetical protein
MSASTLLGVAPWVPCHPWPRRVLSRAGWAAMAEAPASEPTLALLALWADTASVHALLLDEIGQIVIPVSTELPCSLAAPARRGLVRAHGA